MAWSSPSPSSPYARKRRTHAVTYYLSNRWQSKPENTSLRKIWGNDIFLGSACIIDAAVERALLDHSAHFSSHIACALLSTFLPFTCTCLLISFLQSHLSLFFCLSFLPYFSLPLLWSALPVDVIFVLLIHCFLSYLLFVYNKWMFVSLFVS